MSRKGRGKYCPQVDFLPGGDRLKTKLQALEDIIKGFDVGYLASVAKRRDLLTKFRLREKTKEMQRFAMGLGDLKSTLSLALMQQR